MIRPKIQDKVIELALREYTLGRSQRCDVTVDHETVSRQHARLYVEEYRAFIEVELPTPPSEAPTVMLTDQPAPPPPTPDATIAFETPSVPLAGVGARFLALIVDFLIVPGVVIGIPMVFLLQAGSQAALLAAVGLVLAALLGFILALWNDVYLPASRGYSIGKKLLGLRIYTVDGQSPIGMGEGPHPVSRLYPQWDVPLSGLPVGPVRRPPLDVAR